MRKFHKVFRKLSDPRAANAVHDLLDILVIALAAVLCGAKGATDMALFGRSKKKLLQQFLPLKHAIDLARPLMLGHVPEHVVLHVAVLLFYAAFGYYVALVLTRRRLLK